MARFLPGRVIAAKEQGSVARDHTSDREEASSGFCNPIAVAIDGKPAERPEMVDARPGIPPIAGLCFWGIVGFPH
ncbi:hypothetical protein NL676_037576 [Syzygium grande]|nr:hypothetical protein NL676_037576 [Syzygium grande]